MTTFDSYRDRFSCVEFRRHEDGVIVVRFHSNGGPLVWSRNVHHEVADVFAAISRDADNRVVVLTGTGEWFAGPRASPKTKSGNLDTRGWEDLGSYAWHLTWSLLSIDVPVVACVNGPVWRHPEIPLLSDYIVAGPNVTFQDSGHFTNGVPPGDGVALFLPMLMGLTRARRMLYLGEEITASTAFEFGLLSEVVEVDRVMPRGLEVAQELARQNTLLLRYTRRIFMSPVKDLALRHMPASLAMEGLGMVDDNLYSGRIAIRQSKDGKD